MTPEEQKAFLEKINAYVGRDVSPPTQGRDDVNQAMIRHFCEVLGDENPVYTDAEFAAKSSKGGLISPPAMLQVWDMEGYPMCQEPELDSLRQLDNVFKEHGYTGVLGTNTTSEYYCDVRPGDQITTHCVIDSVSDEKATARGIGHFVETLYNFTNQDGEAVGKIVFRILYFIPNDSNDATSSDSGGDDGMPELPSRIASPRGHDNAWWWEAVDKGKVLIQRCKSCKTLRHPPRPMCGECQSMEWDSVESELEGEVFSFTQIHYPKFPGYPHPLLAAVISLSEGTRLISNVVGCEPEDVHIGMKVKGKVEQVDEKTMLPQFYPA